MTLQEQVDKICEKVEKEFTGLSYVDLTGSEYRCLYRSHEGHKCIVGLLIPDEEYSTELEGTSGLNIVKTYDILSDYNGHLLNDIQRIHDRYVLSEYFDTPLPQLKKEIIEKIRAIDLTEY